MSEYPKVIEHPYKVYTGELEYGDTLVQAEIFWSYAGSYKSSDAAERVADRLGNAHEFVKIEEKENN